MENTQSKRSNILNHLITLFAFLLTCSAIIKTLDLDRAMGLVLYTEQYLSFMLCLSLPLVFLTVPLNKKIKRKENVLWFDIICAIIGFFVPFYIAIKYPVLAELTTARPVTGLIAGAFLLILLIEGLRRTVGIVLTIVVIGFLLLSLIGHRIPGSFQGSFVPIDKLIYYLAWDSSGILGMPMRIITTIVIIFILFGQILSASGGSSFFTDIAMIMMGRYRGGPAKISVLSSSLFGTISGSAVSNVFTTGVITIPLMKKGGYPPHLAGAIESVASTGGQLMPPVMGAAAFLMAEFLSIPYTKVVIAAIIPSFLYYLALFMEADLEAARMGLSRIDESLIPPFKDIMKSGWFFPIPFIVLIFALFWLNDLPEKAGLRAIGITVLLGLIVGYKGKRLKLSDIFNTLKNTGLGVLEVIMIGASAGIVIGVLYLSGLSFGLTLALTQMAGGNLFLLLLMTAIVCIILGMGMPTVGVYVLLATMAAPALIEFGILPMAAHMFIMYYGMMSMITPPVALAAFAGASISGADPMKTGYAAMRFGWLAFVFPFMFVISPTLLLQGKPILIIFNFITAVIGTCLVSMAVIGYFSHPLGVLSRIIYAISGLSALFPATGLKLSLFINFFGIIIAILIIFYETYYFRKPKKK